MPFTFSHPAVVLPLNKLTKQRLVSLTALVIGSMTPDFEYFIRMKILSIYSHTWTGLFWYDLPLGLLLFFIYNAWVKDALIDHLPLCLNRRFSSFKNNAPSFKPLFIVIVISILIGTASHILWDSFTHPSGYYVRRIHVLKHRVMFLGQQVNLYNILQQASSVIGALTIIIVIYRLPVGIQTQKRPIFYYWLIIFASTIVTVAIRWATGISFKQIGDLVVTAIAGFFIGLMIASLIFMKKKAIEQYI